MLDPSFVPKLGFSFWPKLYAFYYVAKLQSYSRAAEFLSVSQSSLTRAVQTLESRLKTVLLLRKRGGSIALTEHGQKIFKQLKGMVADLGCLELRADHIPLETQSLSLKISSWILSDYCMDGILQFKQGFPMLGFKIYAATEPNDTVDVGFDVHIESGLIPNKAIVQKPLFNFSLGCYASQRYLHAHGEPRSLKDFSKHLVYQYSQTATLVQVSKHSSKLKTFYQAIQFYGSIHSSTCLVKMAEADCGIIFLIKDHPALKDSGLVPILEHVSEAFEGYTVYFCCSKATWDRQEVKMLHSFLKLQLKNIVKN